VPQKIHSANILTCPARARYRGVAFRPLLFAECRLRDTRQTQILNKCLTVNTWQTMSRAPYKTVTTTVTPLPRPVPVTTSVKVTSCRVRGVGHSATFCQCRVHYAGTRHPATFAECLFWLSAKLEKNIFICPPNFFLCYYSMWWTSYIILVNYPWSLPYLHYLFH